MSARTASRSVASRMALPVVVLASCASLTVEPPTKAERLDRRPKTVAHHPITSMKGTERSSEWSGSRGN